MIQPIIIPQMTDPMGKHWEQPKLEEISFSLIYAWMTKEVFDKLKDYTASQPTGAYEGKMWKAKMYHETKNLRRLMWHLCYFDFCDKLTSRGAKMVTRKNIIIKIES